MVLIQFHIVRCLTSIFSFCILLELYDLGIFFWFYNMNFSTMEERISGVQPLRMLQLATMMKHHLMNMVSSWITSELGFSKLSSMYDIKTTYISFFFTIQSLGLIRQPKWGHLRELHTVIKACSETLLNGNKSNFSLGQLQMVLSDLIWINY